MSACFLLNRQHGHHEGPLRPFAAFLCGPGNRVSYWLVRDVMRELAFWSVSEAILAF
jgi:hypothetical protein